MIKKDTKFISIYDSYKKNNVYLVNKGEDLKLFDGKNVIETLQKDVVSMYHCGITAYSYPTIGNIYASLFSDFLNKGLNYIGFKTRYVQNITDVGHLVGDGDDDKNISNTEDKLQLASRREGKSVEEIVNYYTKEYKKECKALNITLPDEMPFASEYILGQMEIAIKLLNENRAYIIDELGIYFDYEANKGLEVPFAVDFSGDGRYTGRDIKTNAKHEKDFVLWKFVSDDTIQKWKFKDFDEIKKLVKNDDLLDIWGCPGWHGECVAMISTIFTNQNKNGFFVDKILEDKKNAIIDIHTGGEDHIPIHHQNEIWQSTCLGFNLSNIWAHNKHLTVDGRTMSKSKGNAYYVLGLDKPVDSIESKNIDPLAFRLFALEHNYKSKLDFTWDKLKKTQLRLINLRRDIAKLIVDTELQTINHDNQLFIEIQDLIKNDFKTFEIIDLLQKTVHSVLSDITNISKYQEKLSIIKDLDDRFLNLNLFANQELDSFIKVNELSKERRIAKENKDFELSDKIRDQIKSLGYGVDDYSDNKYGIYIINSLLI